MIGSIPLRGRVTAAMMIFGMLLTSSACAAGQGIVEGALKAGRVAIPGMQDILGPALLTRMDLQDAGFPPELLQRTFEEVPVYENPDPRGPCGAPVDDPGFDHAAAAVFATDDGRQVVSETVYDLPLGEANQAIADFRSDLRPGCEPFVAQTPFGPERVELLRPVELGPIGDDRAGALARITAPDGESVYAMTELIRWNNRLMVLQWVDATPPIDVEMRSIAKTALAKLQDLR